MTAPVITLTDMILNDEQVRAINKAAAERKRREGKIPAGQQNKKERVVVVPFSWRQRLRGTTRAATWPVALHLLHLDWKAGGRPFKVSTHGLEEWGVDRHAKRDALEELERQGIIRADGGPGKNPTITILVR
jgi:hypothetical protein